MTGLDVEDLVRSTRLNQADSALHSPEASFGGRDFHPDLIDKAALLACHLAWNHPLIDGNKRASWASLVMFLDLNGVIWEPDPPNVVVNGEPIVVDGQVTEAHPGRVLCTGRIFHARARLVSALTISPVQIGRAAPMRPIGDGSSGIGQPEGLI
jgi:prophage maintenance system killer protein